MALQWGNIAFPKVAALWIHGSDCDVRLICRNGTVKAPSVLLSAVSDKLNEILKLSTDKVLTFKETDVETWTCVLQTLYGGNLVFPTKDVSNGLMTLCSALSFAYCLNIQDVLNLYQHAAHMDTSRQMTELWDNFSLEDGLEVPLEFSHAEDGTLTKYQTIFTSKNFIKLKDMIRKCHDVINLDSRDIEITQDKSNVVEKICMKCGVGKCCAKKVQCLYCNENVEEENGVTHLQEKHLLSPSVIWPVSCKVDVQKKEMCVKGTRILKHKFCEHSDQIVQTLNYKCLVCDYTVTEISSYINHFLTHGFFAQVCEFCGDAFSSATASEKHSMFCGIKDKSAILTSGKLFDDSENSDQEPLKTKRNIIAKVQEAITEDEVPEESNILREIKREDFLSKQNDPLSKYTDLRECVKKDIKGKCTECEFNCKSNSIQCLLCFKTVNNHVDHMFQSHPLSMKAQIWPYTCELKRDTKDMVLRLLETCSFECLLCQKQFSDRETIIFHLQDHKLLSVFFCKHCESGFKNATHRNSHQHFCGGGDYTQCRQCKLFFSTFDQLQQHQVKNHKHAKTTRNETQSDSPERSTPRYMLKEIVVKDEVESPEESTEYTGPRSSKCMTCGSHCLAEKVKCAYCYLVVDKSEEHMEEMHPFTPKSSSWVYNCRFLSKTAVKQHRWLISTKIRVKGSARGRKSTVHRCLLCSVKVVTQKELQHHMKKHHRSYVSTCKVCESGFRSSRYRKDHEHFCEGGGLVECSLCSAVPGSFKTLADHYRRHHYEQMGRFQESKRHLLKKTSEEDYDSSENEMQYDEDDHGEMVDSVDLLMKVTAGENNNKNHTMYCTTCEGPCEAQQVKCLYCFQIVDNSPSHMMKVHAFTPEKCFWVVNCRFINSKAHSGEGWMIFFKERNAQNSPDEGQINYRCIRCHKINFSSIDAVKKHAIQKHSVTAKVCRVCEMGFVKGLYHKDHELFCCGGEPLICHICKRTVGNFKNRSDHLRRAHNVTSAVPKDEQNVINSDINGIEVSDSQRDKSSDSESEITGTENGGNTGSEIHMDDTSVEARQHEKICTSCAGRCTAVKVKCMYCYQVVDKKSNHMAMFHAFTPKSSAWVFSCRFKFSQAQSSERWMVFRKEYLTRSDEGAKPKVMFLCMRCKKHFSSLEIVRKHGAKIHHIKAKTCSVCDMGFEDGRYRKDHELFCKGGKPLTCDICGKMVGNHKHLKDHVRNHQAFPDDQKAMKGHQEDAQSEEPVEERDCDEMEYIDEKEHELDEQHGSSDGCNVTKRKNICGNCGEDKCTSEVVKCLYCHQFVENSAAHMENMHHFTSKRNAWIYSCRLITRVTSIGKSMIVFVKKPRKNKATDGHKNSNFVFKCLKCRVLCLTKKAMVQHMSAKHRLTAYVCSICESGFSTLSLLREHRHFCSGGNVMECDVCGKLTGGLHAMSDHMSRYHRSVTSERLRKRKLFTRNKRPGTNKQPKLDQDNEPDDESEFIEELSEEENETVGVNEDLMQKYFEVIEVQRTGPNVKVCVNCLDNCTSDKVKCFYCGDIVSSDMISKHMQDVHPWTPTKSLFPVTCTFVKHQAVTPEILARPVRDGQDKIKDPVNACRYTCEICIADFENSSAVEKHAEVFHHIRPGFCKTCGLCLKKGLLREHQHFCAGGDMYKCKPCNKVVGGQPHAIKHRGRIHPINPKPKQKQPLFNPRTLGGEDLPRITSFGQYGYTIISADCNCSGPGCTQTRVKCGLCQAIVEKDDRHMKLNHPYSPTNTWIVYCKYSLVSNKKTPRNTVGEKIPDATEDEILNSPNIPCTISHVYRCCKCDLRFDDYYRLKCHLKGVHLQSERLFTCKYCQSYFCNMNSDNFANHVHLCKTGSLFSCNICQLLCSSAKGLYYHMSSNHPEEKRAKQMEYKEDREEDMVVPEGTEVHCTECDFKTTVVLSLREHVKGKHGYRCARLNQVCRFCYKMFQTRSKKERHEQEIHMAEQKILCEICGKEFDIPFQLKTHMYYFHRGGRELASLRKKHTPKSEESAVCPHCGNLYTSLVACKQHIKSVHLNKENYSCSFCSKTFASKMGLKVHEDRHLGNKTYKCPYCSYVAYTGYVVNKHTEKHHPGAPKPFGTRTVITAGEETTNLTTESSALEMPVTIVNSLENLTESLKLEPVDRIEYDGVASFENATTKPVVQYIVGYDL